MRALIVSTIVFFASTAVNAEIDFQYQVAWFSDGPSLVDQIYEFECHTREHRVVVAVHDGEAEELKSFSINGQDISQEALQGLQEFMGLFQRIDKITFDCGGKYVGPNPHNVFGPDFRNQISISIIGRHAEEPDDSESDCHGQGGIFLEEALGNIVISAEKVAQRSEPDLGLCVFGLTSVEIPNIANTGTDL